MEDESRTLGDLTKGSADFLAAPRRPVSDSGLQGTWTLTTGSALLSCVDGRNAQFRSSAEGRAYHAVLFFRSPL